MGNGERRTCGHPRFAILAFAMLGALLASCANAAPPSTSTIAHGGGAQGPSPTIIVAPTNTPMPTPLPTVTPRPSDTPPPIVAPTPQRYQSDAAHITLLYPAGWSLSLKALHFPADFPAFYESPTGSIPGGFFSLSVDAGINLSLESACNAAENEQLQGHYARPRIEHWTAQGQEACLVVPDPTQPGMLGPSGAFVVHAPLPVTDGRETSDYLILRADTVHLRAIAQSLQFTTFPAAHAEGLWEAVAREAGGPELVGDPTTLPPGIETAHADPGGSQGAPHEVAYTGPGKRLMIGLGVLGPRPGDQKQQVRVRGRPGTLLTSTDGQIALSWEEGTIRSDPHHIFTQHITATGVTITEVQAIADSLRIVAPPAPPVPAISHARPVFLSGTPGNGAPKACYTLQEFMEARFAHDAPRALAFLAPELRQRIEQTALYAVSNPEWVLYTIEAIEDSPPGGITARVQIAAQDTSPVLRHSFNEEETITLVRSGDRWLVTDLRAMTIRSVTTATPAPSPIPTLAASAAGISGSPTLPPVVTASPVQTIPPGSPVVQERAIWDTIVRTTAGRITPVLRPAAFPAGLDTVQLIASGSDFFHVLYTGPTKQLHLSVGLLNPPPAADQRQITVRGQRATLNVFPEGHVTLHWDEPGTWQLGGGQAPRDYVSYFLSADGFSPDDVQAIASALVPA